MAAPYEPARASQPASPVCPCAQTLPCPTDRGWASVAIWLLPLQAYNSCIHYVRVQNPFHLVQSTVCIYLAPEANINIPRHLKGQKGAERAAQLPALRELCGRAGPALAPSLREVALFGLAMLQCAGWRVLPPIPLQRQADSLTSRSQALPVASPPTAPNSHDSMSPQTYWLLFLGCMLSTSHPPPPPQLATP